MGLLDFMGTSMDDPKTAATLALAQGLLTGRSGMTGLLGGLQGYQGTMQAAKQREALLERDKLQRQMLEMQAQQMRAAAERASGIDAAYRNAFRTPEQQAMAQNGGPTVAAAGAVGNFRPTIDQNALIAGLAKADPQAAAQMLAPEKPNYMTVDGALVQTNAQGGPKAVFERQKPVELPTSVREFQYGQANPEYNAWAMAQKRAGATNVRVDAGQRFENAYSTNQGKEYSDLVGSINKQGFTAPAQIRKLERISQLLDGVDGGKLAPTGLDIASAMNSIGIKIDPKAGNKEAAEALARELAGGLRQPGTGPMTDKDFENFLTQVPSLSKTAEGRKQITTTMKAALNRDIQVAKMAREYERRHGRVDGGFLDEVAQFIAENPVVGSPSGWKVER